MVEYLLRFPMLFSFFGETACRPARFRRGSSNQTSKSRVAGETIGRRLGLVPLAGGFRLTRQASISALSLAGALLCVYVTLRVC